MKALVVDYGMGNLGSVRRSLEVCGATVSVSSDPSALKKSACLILPGVGSFADGMDQLNRRGLSEALRHAVLTERIPLLGICLGMQLLAAEGEEGGKTQGLGLISGRVTRLVADQAETRVPHVGWNEVQFQKSAVLFDKIPDGSDFYFVHSYQFIPESQGAISSRTPYCGGFVSSVSSGHIFGTQFHPEKSSKRGLQLLKNFLEFSRSAVPC